nr:decapping and exoribonuclease protein-like [Lytechinus pictus]
MAEASRRNEVEVLGNFSIGDDGKYRNDLSQRRYLILPGVEHPDFDIRPNDDHNERESSGREPTSMEPMLHWFRDHQDELIKKGILRQDDSSRRLKIDFVGRIGFFSRLLRAAASVDELQILVTLCNGTYYIEHVKVTDRTALAIKHGESGKKFVKYITSSDGSQPDINEPVDAYKEYLGVMKAQYGDHRIILSTDIDAERKDSDMRPPESYVCIKTRKAVLEGIQLTNYRRYKTLKWWSQPYVAGIPEVIYGMRDDTQQTVTEVKTIETNQLHSEAQGFWDPELCVQKFQSYLSEIKRLVQDDNPRAVYRLQLPKIETGPDTEDRLLNRTFDQPQIKDGYVILPEEYIREVLNLYE